MVALSCSAGGVSMDMDWIAISADGANQMYVSGQAYVAPVQAGNRGPG